MRYVHSMPATDAFRSQNYNRPMNIDKVPSCKHWYNIPSDSWTQKPVTPTLSTRQKDYEYPLHEPQPNNGGGPCTLGEDPYKD